MSKVRAVNGFEIREERNKDNRRVIIIEYKIDNEFFAQSTYYDVDEEKINKIEEKLKDYTSTNQEAEELCRTISLMTIVNAVEKIIFDYWRNELQEEEGTRKIFGSFFFIYRFQHLHKKFIKIKYILQR